MQTGSLSVGDVVEVDIKGRRFMATVEALGPTIQIKPTCSHFTWRSAKAREIVGIWHANTATRRRLPTWQLDCAEHGHDGRRGPCPSCRSLNAANEEAISCI